MKNTLTLLLFLFTISIFSQDWKASYTEAIIVSGETDKPIVLVFSGSDWCAPCKKLDKEIWQSDTFKTYSGENYILYNADFPKKKVNELAETIENQNKMLAERFNPKGEFPLVVVMDKTQKVLGKTGYTKMSPEQYISHLNDFIK